MLGFSSLLLHLRRTSTSSATASSRTSLVLLALFVVAAASLGSSSAARPTSASLLLPSIVAVDLTINLIAAQVSSCLWFIASTVPAVVALSIIVMLFLCLPLVNVFTEVRVLIVVDIVVASAETGFILVLLSVTFSCANTVVARVVFLVVEDSATAAATASYVFSLVHGTARTTSTPATPSSTSTLAFMLLSSTATASRLAATSAAAILSAYVVLKLLTSSTTATASRVGSATTSLASSRRRLIPARWWLVVVSWLLLPVMIVMTIIVVTLIAVIVVVVVSRVTITRFSSIVIVIGLLIVLVIVVVGRMVGTTTAATSTPGKHSISLLTHPVGRLWEAIVTLELGIILVLYEGRFAANSTSRSFLLILLLLLSDGRLLGFNFLLALLTHFLHPIVHLRLLLGRSIRFHRLILLGISGSFFLSQGSAFLHGKRLWRLYLINLVENVTLRHPRVALRFTNPYFRAASGALLLLFLILLLLLGLLPLVDLLCLWLAAIVVSSLLFWSIHFSALLRPVLHLDCSFVRWIKMFSVLFARTLNLLISKSHNWL